MSNPQNKPLMVTEQRHSTPFTPVPMTMLDERLQCHIVNNLKFQSEMSAHGRRPSAQEPTGEGSADVLPFYKVPVGWPNKHNKSNKSLYGVPNSRRFSFLCAQTIRKMQISLNNISPIQYLSLTLHPQTESSVVVR